MSRQTTAAFETKKIRYACSDTPEHIYRQIKESVEGYFKDTNLPKHATIANVYKMVFLAALTVIGYWSLTQVNTFYGMAASYMLLTFASMILSINLGHDAAHHAVTGNKRIDDTIFKSIFAAQGISGYVWQVRHNYSHHVLPNVKEHDSDMELTKLILLEHDSEGARWYHRFQHIYAPFLYSMVSFSLLFAQDFKFFTQKSQANLYFEKIPRIEWFKMLIFKAAYFTITFGLPMYFSSLSFVQIFGAWALVHCVVSVFVAFTFFISHHVTELDYIGSGENSDLVSDSWIHHQITTTVDFSPECKFSHFLFGGFNLHIAHHIFPEVSHQHYPALTKIIKNVLAENNASDWYKSFSFRQGCISHIKHLRNIGQQSYANHRVRS